jgi:transcriptional antiterminator RfaH
VEVLEGPFAGLTGVFKSVNSEERAFLLLDLLGRQNTVGVNMDCITKVGTANLAV